MVHLADPSDTGNAPGDGPLRSGGTAAAGPTTETHLPSTPSEAVKSQAPALALMRDLVAGPEQVREKRQAYLPQAPGESPKNYQYRLDRSPYFNVVGHTVEGLTGFVFRKDPVLADDVPPIIKEHWENIDLAGTHGDVFARNSLEDALAAGHAAILVEFPKTDGVQTAAPEIAGEIRPYWVPIRKDDILSWRTTVEKGRLVLTQLVLRESQYVPDGEYGEALQVRYRVFYRTAGIVGFRLLEITKDRTVTLISEGTYPTQDEIPVSEIATSGRIGLFESRPPLLDLAYLNIAHYQQYSDYMWSIHKTCVPVLFTAGVIMEDDQGNTVVVGPNSMLSSPDPQAKAEYVSHGGEALDASKKSLDDLKSDMAALGLAMLAPDKRVAETAEAKRLDKATGDSKLAVTARGLEDGLERCLGFHAKYLRLPSGGSIEINRDFDMLQMPSDVMAAYVRAVKDAGFPVRMLLEEWQAGGRIAENVDLDKLELEMLAQGAAEEDAEADAEEPDDAEELDRAA